MNLRYAFALTALAAILIAAGCSNSSNSTVADTPDSNNSAAAAAPASSGISSEAPADAADSSAPVDLTSAIDSYRTYVIQETDALVKDTGAFVDAINSGKLEEAKKLYAPARMHYERIEPIAEALGDLDPSIDARDGDVDPAEWRGFHRLEKALWEDKTTDGTKEFADRLLSDTKLLRAKVETVEIAPSLLVTGAVELLNEVSTSKVTGEEDRYSRTDLYDFAANVEGAQKIYELLQPSLAGKDAELDQKIAASFKVLQDELNAYAKDGGYVSYDVLKEDEVRKLSQNLDALAEPLSQMGTLLGV
ncbi:iron ABC transporter substrate-binding protein [Paenibacillus yonginensis]|uniref:Iron ABC transporter substrate-binding protein n=1 Tax=Paenibacillus yonginensis TaxID=1462996 RepID=A0A1B1N298_9BACL|nr:iron uptake system protein EfeO [Paenibacillus yonginensis]ANS75562.1 iron ABC transporter substrate-binding protein [Paenibacillus yonginensis]